MAKIGFRLIKLLKTELIKFKLNKFDCIRVVIIFTLYNFSLKLPNSQILENCLKTDRSHFNESKTVF